MANSSETLDAILQRLLQNEKRSAKSPEEAVLHSFEKMRKHISKIMGMAGYKAILSRALQLSRNKDPSLAELKITEDGKLEGVTSDEASAQLDMKSAEILFGVFFHLLATFIGEELTVNILSDILPGRNAGSKESLEE